MKLIELYIWNIFFIIIKKNPFKNVFSFNEPVWEQYADLDKGSESDSPA